MGLLSIRYIVFGLLSSLAVIIVVVLVSTLMVGAGYEWTPLGRAPSSRFMIGV